MTVELKPETKRLLDEMIENGHFDSVKFLITRAVSVMQKHEISKAVDPREAVGRILKLSVESRPSPEGWTAVDYVRQDANAHY